MALRVQPGARRAGVEGPLALGDGRVVLKVRVSEPPHGGKANAALIMLLARAWKLPKRTIRVVAGGKERHKTLLVEGDPGELAARLEAWLGTLGQGPA